ncbi:DNA topoisomerase IB [Andreprevotia sp. IGB-42]|uniref:DNA topoisomerase IB n=1 Tax=Andreprevotia sp. IGB-42 TaxID=2497473 RepID=UPI001F3222C0|nr:DNA topoisomerase IB [Andreprevotia sp. IGB-42]
MQTVDEAAEAAREAGLRYVNDTMPGISRHARRGKLVYVRGNEVVDDAATLARIRALVIPPAWTDVWICPRANGHLQATGRDAKGRKQYRYHARWRERRDESKFARMIAFGEALPQIRTAVSRDLAKQGMPREKVLALVVLLLESTFIRVGNEVYARENKSFGLTTLRNRHVAIDGKRIRFHFRGKSGKDHDIELNNARIARIVMRCRDLPGQDLFQYLDDAGHRHPVTSGDVNQYLKEISGEDFSAKDFRTWAGTVLAAVALCQQPQAQSAHHAKGQVADAVKQVAERLGNTVAVCRKCYIHPEIINAYLAGNAIGLADGNRIAQAGDDLRVMEQAVLSYLRELATDR